MLVIAPAAEWWLVKACAPSFPTAIFNYSSHPDLPTTDFIDGRMGVLQPTFARSYLVIAYRYLNGVGLDERERDQAREYYEARETGTWGSGGEDGVKRWQQARSEIKAVAVPESQLVTLGKFAYDPENHSFGLNCAEDAFRVAAQTLEARRTRFGETNPHFLDWVKAQDIVFHNCDSSPAIPAEAAADAPKELRDDRQYQIAGAEFYGGQYEEAIKRFRRMSEDATSEWSTISRYLVVRTLLRMEESDKVKAEAERILADTKLAAIHGMTWNLVERAEMGEKSPAYFRELGNDLAEPGQDERLKEELWNYTTLYDRLRPYNQPEAGKLDNPDLTDWISNYQTQLPEPGPHNIPHSMERWQQTHSTAWLLAALERATPGEAERAGLLTAAARIPENSPAYLTAAYFINRIALDAGEKAAVRKNLATLMASKQLRGLPSSMNLFRGFRMRAAPTLDDFLTFAVRTPVLISDLNYKVQASDLESSAADSKPEQLLDGDATTILNSELPFTVFLQAASSPRLPLPLRQELLITAFTRGLMLHKDLGKSAEELGRQTPGLRKLTTAYEAETTEEGRRFAAAFLLLHRPESRPYLVSGIDRNTPPGELDRYRDNWWCPTDVGRRPNTGFHADPFVAVAFPGRAAMKQAESEVQTIAKVPGPVEFLGSIVLAHQKRHPDDPRIPEALHDLVVHLHLACDVGQAGKTFTFQSAFELLHSRYPDSIWARRTPIWWNEV